MFSARKAGRLLRIVADCAERSESTDAPPPPRDGSPSPDRPVRAGDAGGAFCTRGLLLAVCIARFLLAAPPLPSILLHFTDAAAAAGTRPPHLVVYGNSKGAPPESLGARRVPWGGEGLTQHGGKEASQGASLMLPPAEELLRYIPLPCMLWGHAGEEDPVKRLHFPECFGYAGKGLSIKTTFPRVSWNTDSWAGRGLWPGSSRQTEDLLSLCFILKREGGMASPSGDHPPKPAAAKPLTDLDFRSGARIKELNQLIQEYEARNPGVRGAPELLHQAKDVVFSLLGLVQKTDGKLPPVNRYLILSGGAQQGTVHVAPSTLLFPGGDYDVAFTLLVPILHAAGVPVTLDMQHRPPGHTQLSLRPFDSGTFQRWSDCCSGEEAYLSAGRVSNWFFHSFATVAKELRVEQRSCVTSVVISVGPSRILYDIVPVVALQGWPAVGEPWLTQAHFWDGKLQDPDVTGSFYLLPSASGADWSLAFTASELQLRKVLSLPLLQAFHAAVALLGSKHCHPLISYHFFTLALWSCERLPSSYLGREENAAHALLGLLDDLSASLVHRCLPNYFLPQWNLLEGLSRQAVEHLAKEVARVRADPSQYLRQAVEGVKEAKRLAKAFRNGQPPLSVVS